MPLRPYKFLVQAIAQEHDGDTVTGERASEPVTVFGCDQLEQWARDFPDKLATAAEGASVDAG